MVCLRMVQLSWLACLPLTHEYPPCCELTPLLTTSSVRYYWEMISSLELQLRVVHWKTQTYYPNIFAHPPTDRAYGNEDQFPTRVHFMLLNSHSNVFSLDTVSSYFLSYIYDFSVLSDLTESVRFLIFWFSHKPTFPL